MTLAIPSEISKIVKKHPEIKWTEIGRRAIIDEAKKIEIEKDPLRYYSLKRLAEGDDDADKLFKL